MSSLAVANTTLPTQQAAKAGFNKITEERNWINNNKDTASKEDIASHAAAAQTAWKAFVADTAGLQQSADDSDRRYAGLAYGAAASIFVDTQSDYKEVLGGREAGDLSSGDALATSTQQSLSSLIDQGNAMALHAQQLLNEGGRPFIYQTSSTDGGSGPAQTASANGGPGPIAGGTASPNTVSDESRAVFDAALPGGTPNPDLNLNFHSQ